LEDKIWRDKKRNYE